MEYGWHAVFELGIAAGGAAFVLSFGLREAPGRAQLAADVQRANGTWMYPGLAAILVATALVGGVFAALFSFIQPYAVARGVE